MIAPTKIKEVQILIAQGEFSQRKIARMTGVSRATIGAIAAGKRPDYEERQRLRQLEAAEEPAGPVERCPGCGGLVHMPCRLCRVRRIKAQEQAALQFYRSRARQRALHRLIAAIRRASSNL